jgi:hypothetical protein
VRGGREGEIVDVIVIVGWVVFGSGRRLLRCKREVEVWEAKDSGAFVRDSAAGGFYMCYQF